MTVHNPLNQSRLCPNLGRNLEPYEVVDTPDKFEQCDGCKCVVLDEEKPEPKGKK